MKYIIEVEEIVTSVNKTKYSVYAESKEDARRVYEDLGGDFEDSDIIESNIDQETIVNVYEVKQD